MARRCLCRKDFRTAHVALQRAGRTRPLDGDASVRLASTGAVRLRDTKMQPGDTREEAAGSQAAWCSSPEIAESRTVPAPSLLRLELPSQIVNPTIVPGLLQPQEFPNVHGTRKGRRRCACECV